MQGYRTIGRAALAGAALLAGMAVLQAPAVAQDKDKLGFIYVGPAADYGYNMSMDLGRIHVEKELGVSAPPRSRRCPRPPRWSG